MPAHKKPKALARLVGADLKNPGRFAGQVELTEDDFPGAMAPLGPASKWLNKQQATCFEDIRTLFPWLKEHSRINVELAATLYARMRDPKERMIASDISQLRALLGGFGGAPAELERLGASILGGNDTANVGKSAHRSTGTDAPNAPKRKGKDRFFAH